MTATKSQLENEYQKLPIVCHSKTLKQKQDLEKELDDLDKNINKTKTWLRELKSKVY